MTNATYRVRNHGKISEISIGTPVTVFRCGGGLTTFGEPGNLSRATKKHLVFITESGAEVKTAIDSINTTVGKAKAERYCVTLRAFESFDHMIKEAVAYWNPKTCQLEKK